MTTSVPINKNVAQALAGLFGAALDSDCDIVFCLETVPEAEAPAREAACTDIEEPALKRPRLNGSEGDDGSHSRGQAEAIHSQGAPAVSTGSHTADGVLGPPLPGHQLILRYASERFAAQLDRWGTEEAAAPSRPLPVEGAQQDQPGHCTVSPSVWQVAAVRRPRLRVMLGSESEVPATRAAIAFAYTGQVQGDSICELLEVRRQGAYIGMDGCPAECDAALKAKLSPGTPEGASAAALELYASSDLFPDGVDDSSFATVLVLAKPALVKHFSDALSVLSKPAMRAQLLALPAMAVEALLESDNFGTDTESSVLLLLATWMDANYLKTDEATRKRLCSRVRLVQLSRPYLSLILPALAADYEAKPQEPAGWFPVSVLEAAFIGYYASASAVERKRAEEENRTYDMGSAAYSTKRRAQCVPRGGASFKWHVAQQELEQSLAILQPDESLFLEVDFEGDLMPVSDGFAWTLNVSIQHGASAAGMFLKPRPPAYFKAPGCRLAVIGRPPILVEADAEMSVFGANREPREEVFSRRFGSREYFRVGPGRGWGNALPLEPQQVGAETGAESAGPLAGWANYIHGGKLSGALTFFRPSSAR